MLYIHKVGQNNRTQTTFNTFFVILLWNSQTVPTNRCSLHILRDFSVKLKDKKLMDEKQNGSIYLVYTEYRVISLDLRAIQF